uniref:Plasmodium RESA N-terminal domain-containing protein n=1 Tax=Schistosoma japonicum TaxID=6182 RepID=C1LIZ2_SCHJA|nr:hypothetical protein [Schistosoma japonicum]
MLLLLLYINVSLMLIHESTQLKHPREEISRIKDNILNIKYSLHSRLHYTRRAKQIMQEQEDAMKSHLKNHNRSIDEYLNCAKKNLYNNRGKTFVKEMSIFMKSKTVLGTKYYNETIETWKNCFSKMKAKFDEVVSKNRMYMCDLLINPNLHGLNKLAESIVNYYENNLQYNMWLFIYDALSNIVEEHEYSGATVK